MDFENKYARFMRNTGPGRFFVPLGIILIVFGCIMFGFKTDNYLETTGRITSVTETYSTDAENNTVTEYDLKVSYTVDGKAYEGELSNMNGSYSEGADIKLFYDPADPAKITNSKLGNLFPIIFIAAGVLALAAGIIVTVRAFKKSSELDRIAPAADAAAQAALDNIKTAPGVTEYYFRYDGHGAKAGYVIEDAARNVLYEGRNTKVALAGSRPFDFTDCRSGYTQQHEIGHVVTQSYNDEMFSMKSSFKFDGKRIWDYLHEQGYRLSTNIHSKFPYLIYDVLKDGAPLARIETCSVYVHEEDEAQHKLKIPTGNKFYRFWTASDDIEMLFLIIFALSECEQVIVE